MRALIMANPITDFFNALGFLRPVIEVLLGGLYKAFHSVPVLDWIGAYGLSIIALTLVIKTVLFPVFQMQLKLSKKAQAEQKKVAPELAVLRKKYKGDPTTLNREMMALYKEHGVHPLSSMMGCLPALVQMPILIGLYRAIIDQHFFQTLGVHNKSFLFVHDLTHAASLHDPTTWVLPALVGATTFVQSKMFVTPNTGAPDDPQAAQMAQVSQTLSLMMPLFLVYLSFIPSFSLGLVLYYTISNLYSITQQYFVNGWGALPILGTRANQPEPVVRGGGGKAAERGRGGTVSNVLASEPDLRTNPRRRRKR